MLQKDINELNERAYQAAHNVPFEQALRFGGYTGEIKKRGNSIFYQCTNGCDENKSLDKCAINLSKNMSHCFACGEGWDSAKVVSQMMNIPYNHAALLLAKEVGAVSEEECSEVLQAANYKKMVKSTVNLKAVEKASTKEAEFRRPATDCDLVYRHLLSLPQFSLSDEHRAYLKKERGYTDAEIDEAGFFTYKDCIAMEDLLTSIRLEKPAFSPNEFWGIAGFYMVFVNKEKTQGYWEFRRPYKNCVGIPLKNAKGEIVALQMRALSSDFKGAKYFFVTSKGYEEDGKTIGYGTTPGSPAHVEYPSMITNSLFMISEGKFKVYEMAKEGSIAFSCQGVNNFAYVVDEIGNALTSPLAAKKMHPDLIKHRIGLVFAICYDADMYENVEVLNASMKLCKALKKKYPKVPTKFILWDLAYGKGYDDMKAYAKSQGVNFHSLCFVVDSDTFNELSESAINAAKERYTAAYGKTTKAKMQASAEFKALLREELWDNRLKAFQH